MSNVLTRNGVAKDLNKSPFTFTYVEDDFYVEYYFSSNLHLLNFVKRRFNNYSMIYNYIYKRFKFKLDCQILSDCNLYQKIETRGFYIIINGKEYTCSSKVILNGGSKTKKSLEEWQETLMIN